MKRRIADLKKILHAVKSAGSNCKDWAPPLPWRTASRGSALPARCGARGFGERVIGGADLRAMLETLPPTLAGARDRALLLIGFGAALRRSELASLDVGDVSVTKQGLIVVLRRSKTDQEGAGVDILAGARARYQESLAISQRLAAADPSSASLQRDVWVSMWRLQRFPESGITWARIVAAMEAMQARGVLLPTDTRSLEQARNNAATDRR